MAKWSGDATWGISVLIIIGDIDAVCDVGGAFNAASVGSWRSIGGGISTEFLRSMSGILGLLALPPAPGVDTWGFFLKLRFISELAGVLS
jgi:hypothetical protein